jgi:pimeloyl-ACP methyl ester carboxylesterase
MNPAMQRITISTASLSYIDRGTGTPVLLVHGFPLDHTMWDAQIDALSEHYRVIAPDLRGYGESKTSSGKPDAAARMEEYAKDLVELLDALKITEPVAFVGLSMGGYIAWQFMRNHGDRVRALVLLDTRAAADTDEARAGRHKMAENVEAWGSGRIAEIMGPKLFLPSTFEEKPHLVAAVRHIVEKTPPAAIAAAALGMAERPDMAGFLPSIKVPTLVICGEGDAISPPAEMKSVAATIPNSKYVEIPDAGHMTTMENPEAVNAALLDFLKDVSR